MTGHAVHSPAARRAFALVALITGALPPLLIVALLLRDPLELIVAVLLVGCAVAAAWATLVRRGPRRIAPAAAAVIALAGTAVLPDIRAYLWLPVVAVLVVLSAARPGRHWAMAQLMSVSGWDRRGTVSYC